MVDFMETQRGFRYNIVMSTKNQIKVLNPSGFTKSIIASIQFILDARKNGETWDSYEPENGQTMETIIEEMLGHVENFFVDDVTFWSNIKLLEYIMNTSAPFYIDGPRMLTTDDAKQFLDNLIDGDYEFLGSK